jgi:hypothetical protein
MTPDGTVEHNVASDEQKVSKRSMSRSLALPAVGALAVLVLIAVVLIAQRGGDDASRTPSGPGAADAGQSVADAAPDAEAAPDADAAPNAPDAPDTPAEVGESDFVSPDRDHVVAASQWVLANLPSGSRVLADATVDGELGRVNAPQQHAVLGSTDGWRDFDYLVSTPGLRAELDQSVIEAITSSTLLASFGPEPGQVEVRRLESAGPQAVQARQEAQAAAGAQLARNPQLILTPESRSVLREGAVDPRLIVLLAAAVDRHELTVADFPARAGEEGGPRRTAVITAVDAEPPVGTEAGQALRSWLDAQEAPFAPASAAPAEGALVLGFDITTQPPVDFLAEVSLIDPLPA